MLELMSNCSIIMAWLFAEKLMGDHDDVIIPFTVGCIFTVRHDINQLQNDNDSVVVGGRNRRLSSYGTSDISLPLTNVLEFS